jgi:hypothetical protein
MGTKLEQSITLAPLDGSQSVLPPISKLAAREARSVRIPGGSLRTAFCGYLQYL